jgi:hypothetical protein
MFGHQDDQHRHHDDDHKNNDVLSEPVAEHLTTENHDDNNDFNPALPAADTTFAPQADVPAPASDDQPHDDHAAPVVAGPVDNDLLSLKQQALTSLSPLVDHLEQTPEEKFRTTMMMIQASDNKDLIKNAYEAANQITDEKVKAQALLDIVNEINYFTQQNA